MTEIVAFKKLLQLMEVAFDRGALGHEQVKPTRLLTSSWHMYKPLQGKRVAPGGRGPMLRPQGWRERFEQSRSWASWAVGLCEAVIAAWIDHQRSWHDRNQDSVADQARLRALNPDWEKHFHQDHLPFRRDCAVCVEAAAKQRPHYRQDHPSVFTMALDVAGPFFVGVDSDETSKHRYLLVAVYAIPVLQQGKFVWHEPKDVAIPADVEFEEDTTDPPAPAADPLPEEGEKERVSRVKEYVKTISQPIKVKTLISCEPLPSRRQGDVRLAAMRLHIRLVNAGCPVHSSRTGSWRKGCPLQPP